MTRAFKVNISAPSIIKDGGTSSQFLKADGSVDSLTYLTTGTASSTYQPLDADLTAIAALASGTGLLKNTAGTWSLDTSSYLTTGTAASTYLPLTGGTISSDLTITGSLTVNGTTTNLNSTNLVIEDKNIIIADVATPTNTTADGAGITIKGATDKTFTWVNATGYLTSNVGMEATSFVKTSGTSAQFLKANGSVDSATYLTTGTASSTYAPIVSPSFTTPNIGAATGTSVALTGDMTTIGDGSTTASPRIFGISSWGTSDAAQFRFGDGLNTVQASYGGKMSINAYHGIQLRGAQAGATPSFDAGGAGADIGVHIVGTSTGSIVLALRGASGQTAVLQKWSSWNGTTDTQVGSLTNAGALAISSTISASGLAGSLLTSTPGTALGTASAGSSAIPAQSDHVHPTTGLATSGANSNITSLTGLTTALSATQGGTAQTTYTTGDILYSSATNTIAKLAIGTTGQVLTVSGGIPSWGAAGGGVSTAGGSTITVASGTTVPLTIQNNGTGNSFVVNDEASDTTPFVIDAVGNVGIGTTSLDWLNTGRTVLDINGSTDSLISLKYAGTTNAYLQAMSGYFNIFSTNTIQFGTTAAVPMILSTNSTERMQIDSAGNVGIGTASPTTKLDILSNSASLTGLSVSPHSSGLTATITAAVQSGGTVTYTATNTFTAGQQVTITGITPTTYNVNNVTIKTATGSNFTIATATLGGTYVSGGTATAYANLQEWQTNAGTQLSAISQNGAFSSSSTETIIENSGDTFGTTRLRLQNRGGQAGPLFEQAGTVDVVDFGFKIPSSQSLIRYEGRYGSQFSANPVTSTNGPEFQFGNASTTTQGATVGTWFPLVVGAGLLDKRVQINSTTGNNTALTIKAIPTKTATITGATVTTFTNKSGTIVIPQAVSASFSRITGIASTTGLLAGMTLTYVSGTGTFGGGTATIISVDSSTAITVYTTAVAVAGATVFSIQNSVTYTATNAFSQTHGVTITGATAAGLNVAGATIGAVTGSTFTIINTTASGTWSSGGIATITQTSNLTDWIGSADTSIASISAEGNLTANQFIASNNGNGTNFKVGDDVWIGDINIANTMSVRGAQSAASGFIRFGSDTNALGYNGTAFSYGGAMTATSFNSITGFPVSGTPAMNGSASLGSATTTSRSDHIHPTDTSRAAVGQTMYIGTTAVAINRSTASLSLTGVSINGNAGTVTNGIYTTTTSLPNVTSVNGTTIPSAATLLTSGGALGTPSGGTLTNAIGLPISGLVASTTTAIGVGSIELGHATDTTIARVSAGVVSIEGNNILTAASTASALTSTGTITSGTWSGSFGAVSGANLTSLTAANISSGTLGSGVVPTQGTTTSGASGLGYMGMPQNVNPGSVSIQATDAGKHLYYTTTGQTLTIPAATALALPIGFTFTVINAAAVRTTIAITTDTMYLAGTGATGSRTLVPYGMATAVKVSGVSSAGVWMISGSGLT